MRRAWRLLFCFAALAGCTHSQAPQLLLARHLDLADCDGIAARGDDVFLACHSSESSFRAPVQGSRTPTGMMSAYVLRLDTRAGRLVYATRLGGDGFTAAFRIKVDREGFAYTVGLTKARDFPVTSDAAQQSFGGGDSDAFLAKLAPDGRLAYSTYLGGSGADQGNGLTFDGADGILVAGTTWSSDFPGLAPHSTAGRSGDAFIARLTPGEPSSLRAVAYGGSDEEKLTGLTRDGNGGVFAVGYTKSRDFPVVEPVQQELRGISDLFLLRMQITDLKITFATFLGGAGDDSGWGVAVDMDGNPVVSGATNSRDLKTEVKVFQGSPAGGFDAFIAKLRGPGYRDVRLTYFGGTGDDFSGYDGDNLTLDAAGNVWLAGVSASADLPITSGAVQGSNSGDSDGFVAAFSPDLTRLCYSTYLGGAERDLLEGIDVSRDGRVFATGVTFSKDSPTKGRRARPSSVLLALRAPEVCR